MDCVTSSTLDLILTLYFKDFMVPKYQDKVLMTQMWQIWIQLDFYFQNEMVLASRGAGSLAIPMGRVRTRQQNFLNST